MKRRDLKIIWHSNSVNVNSGYATFSRDLLFRLLRDGWNVANIGFFGVEGYHTFMNGEDLIDDRFKGLKLKVYPKMNDPYGSDALVSHSADFGAHVAFAMLDIWTIQPQALQELNNNGTKFIPYLPIDQEPIYTPILSNLNHAYKIITFAKYGQKQLQNAGYTSTLILEGVDTEIFKPMDKAECRKELDLPQENFFFGMIGANKENPPRKGYQEAIEAFKMFLDKHPEARMFFHTQQVAPGGFPILEFGKYLNIHDKMYFLNPYKSSFASDSHKIAREINTFDILLHPSQTEGFGLLPVEAQSCFPEEIKVSMDNILSGQVRKFTGELVEIKTSRGTIRSTPEHPFYTDNGWVKAGELTKEYHLLYNNEHDKRGVYKGRIKEVFESLSRTYTRGSGKNHEQDIQFSSMAQKKGGLSKNNEREIENEKSKANKDRFVVFSGDDRRRRPSHNKKNEWWEMETLNINNKRFRNIDELVKTKNTNEIFLYRKKGVEGKWSNGLFVSYNRDFLSQFFQGYFALSGDKKREIETSNQMDRNETKTRKQRTSKFREISNDSENDKAFELVKIESIQRSTVKNLLVYNFTTNSNVYLANGYLVHNCGVPPIVNNCHSQPEMIIDGKTGEICEIGKGWFRNMSAYVYPADVNSLYDKMETLYAKVKDEKTRKQIAKDARQNVLDNYNIEKVADKFISFLETLQDEILPIK